MVDISLAKGVAGTKVVKESLDILILDGYFASIVKVSFYASKLLLTHTHTHGMTDRLSHWVCSPFDAGSKPVVDILSTKGKISEQLGLLSTTR